MVVDLQSKIKNHQSTMICGSAELSVNLGLTRGQIYSPHMSEDESLVISKKQLFADSILPQNKDELAQFIDQPFPALAEVIMGALASGLKGWPLVAGHIVQGAFKG